MDTNTGEMLLTPEALDEYLTRKPEARGHIVQLPAGLAQQLVNMNRRQRREYYRNHKIEFKGLSWAEVVAAVRGD